MQAWKADLKTNMIIITITININYYYFIVVISISFICHLQDIEILGCCSAGSVLHHREKVPL